MPSNGGRPPKPTNLKKLEGNPGKRPLNKKEPKVTKPARCPAWLTKEAKREWARIAPILKEMGILTAADQISLAVYCQAYADYIQTQKIIQKKGMTYEYVNKAGVANVVSRPEVLIAQKNAEIIRKFCIEFGLTPSSRGRIQLPEEGGPASDLEKILNN